MAAVWLRFRSELRTRWQAWLVLAVLAGIASGLVVAAIAGARRTENVVDRHYAEARAADVYLDRNLLAESGALDALDFERIAGLPQVAGVERQGYPVVISRSSSGEPLIPFGPAAVQYVVPTDGRAGTSIDRPKLLAGRLPDPGRADEALADSRAVERLGIGVGESILVRLLDSRSPNIQGYVSPRVDPKTAEIGPLATVRLVGVNAAAFPDDWGGYVQLTPAFWQRYGGSWIVQFREELVVRLARGQADLAAFRAGVERIAGERHYDFLVPAQWRPKVEHSVSLQAQTLWLLSLFGAVAGLALVGQALARRAVLEAGELPVLRALGMTRRQLTALAAAEAGAVGGVAAGLAVAVAYLCSPLTPFGRAGELEPDPGFAFDGRAIGLGALIVLGVVLFAGTLAGWRVTRARRAGVAPVSTAAPEGAGATAGALGRVASPSLAAGIRMALAGGARGSRVPVRAALASALLAVGVAAMALTFSASLGHLLDTPRLYGVNWDYETAGFSGDPDAWDDPPNPTFSGVAVGTNTSVRVGGLEVGARAVDDVQGSVPPVVLEGRAPRAPDEILLGTKTLDALGAHVGDLVPVEGTGASAVPMRIVGRGVLPPTQSNSLGEGAALSFEALERVSPNAEGTMIQTRIAPDVDRKAVLEQLDEENQGLSGRLVPTEITDFGGVDEMPFAVAAVFVAAAATFLAYTLVTSVRKRRRELAILKTLGFTRGQVLTAVAWQATTVAAIGLAVGLPLGVGLGRWTWMLFAEDLGVVPEPVTPLLPVLVVVPATILLANLVALLPGRIAARTQPALVLRAE